MGMYLDVKKIGKISFILLIVFALFGDFMNSFLHVPAIMSRYVVFYMSYILIACVIFRLVSFNKYNRVIFHMPKWQIGIFLFLIYIVISAIVSTDARAILNYLRVYVVGYSVFCGSILFIDREFINKWIYKSLYFLLIIHCLLTAAEYVLYREQDMAGGIFGIEYGRSNTLSHAFIFLCALAFFAAFITKKIKPLTFYSIIAICALTAALAEIKIFYFELIALLFVYFLLSKQYLRSLIMILFIGVVIYIGAILTIKYNPDFVNFFSQAGVEKYLASGYGGKEYAVSRTNGYSFIYEVIFDKSLLKTIFGNGFTGKNAEIVSLYNVEYFTYSTVFYYGGIIGSLLYFSLPLYFAFSIFRKSKDDFTLVSCLTGFAILFTSIYSAECLASASSALYYFMLSLGANKLFGGYNEK